MTILLTGATGFLGGWVARLLAETRPDSLPIRILARPWSDLSRLQGIPYQLAESDLLDTSSLWRALGGVQEVYHVAGLISFRPQDAELVRRINFDGAINLFGMSLAAGIEKMVYAASIFAAGLEGLSQAGDSLKHATGLLDIPYIRAKWDAEQSAHESMKRGLPLVKVYPGICLGPGDVRRSSTGAVDAWLQGRLPTLITGGGVPVVDVRDAAAALIAGMRAGLPGEPYFATGHNMTLTELFDRLAKMAGRAAPPLRLPPTIGIPLATLAEKLRLPLPRDAAQARLMAHRWWFDPSRATEKLGVHFRPLEETLADTIAWLRENPV